METFFSIQGEGFHSGKSAYFIRIGGCDVGCHWCDVKESWDHGKHQIVGVDDIVSKISGTNLVIITGGEPLMWDMTVLTKKIKKIKWLFILKHQVPIIYLVNGIGYVYHLKNKNFQRKRSMKLQMNSK